MKTAEELLVAAATLVERPDGWCQHVLVDRDGRVCLLGALYVAAGAVSLPSQVWAPNAWDLLGAEFHAALQAVTQEVNIDPVFWNNAPGRTAIEVSTALRNAKAHVEPLE